MTPISYQAIKNQFTWLRMEVPNINGIALVSSDGQLIYAEWGEQLIDQEKIGAVASALLGLGKKSIEILAEGTFLQVSLQSTESTLSVYSAGKKAVLIVGLKKEGILGLLNMKARQVTEQVSGVLEND